MTTTTNEIAPATRKQRKAKAARKPAATKAKTSREMQPKAPRVDVHP